jgi:hypothetical protein
VRGRAVKRRWPALALAATSACSADAIVVGEAGPRGSGLGDDAPADLVTPSCPDPATERRSNDECWPTRHVGRWHGFVSGRARYGVGGVLRDYPSTDVTLEIDADGSGRLALGVPVGEPLAQAAPAPACADLATDPACSEGAALLPGFAYSLTELSMAGGSDDARRDDPRVQLTVHVAEPWDTYCRSLTPPTDCGDAAACASGDGADTCACNGERCTIVDDLLRWSLSLSADASAMRGSAASEPGADGASFPVELVRE